MTSERKDSTLWVVSHVSQEPAPICDRVVGVVQIIHAVHSGQAIPTAGPTRHEPSCCACAKPCTTSWVDPRVHTITPLRF